MATARGVPEMQVCVGVDGIEPVSFATVAPAVGGGPDANRAARLG